MDTTSATLSIRTISSLLELFCPFSVQLQVPGHRP